jgi:hypothetical protein
MRYEENPGWHDELEPDKDRWFGDIVLDIGVDAELIAPIDTGHLKQSITADVNGDTGIVEAGAHYALYVEEGHRIAYRGSDGEVHYTGGVVPPQPFLKVALFKQR